MNHVISTLRRTRGAALALLGLPALGLVLLAHPVAAQQQQMPPRAIGSLQIDAITTAPLQLIRGVTLDATPQQVFDLVTDHERWPELLTPIESVHVKGNGRKGSTRSFTLAGGAGTVRERIVAYDVPGKAGAGTFAYSAAPGNPFGVENHLAVIELRPADGGGTVLTYHQLFDHPNPAALLPRVAAGTDEILSNILYAFGGEPRGATQGLDRVVIEQRRVVDASSKAVWRVLGEQWGDVDEWASVISHSSVSDRKGSSLQGATRSCEVPGTPGFRETMIAYDEHGLTLAYQVLEGVPPFVTRAVNTWNIEPLASERVVLTSRIELAIAPGTPVPAIGMVKGQFTRLIDLAADELVHFVETGKPHPRKVAARKAARG